MDARIIIMDEPTSSLTPVEAEKLSLKVVADLKAAGIGIIYISHRFAEIMRIADRMTVMKDGRRHVGDACARQDHQPRPDRVADGRPRVHHPLPGALRQRRRKRRRRRRAADRATTCWSPGARQPLSFSARRGEIVGFAGLVGAGRTELMRVLFGVDRPLAGLP